MPQSVLTILCLTVWVFLFSLNAAQAAAGDRIALVIGNGRYEHAPALPNPTNDARDIAAAFEALDYDVRLIEDAGLPALLDALRAHRARSLGAAHSVIYYAGHGVEIDRQNYVIPVDAELASDIDVAYEAIPLDLIVAATVGARDLQLVVLDACRDNPFLEQMTRTVATRSIGRGLALYEPDGNSLVAYSAKEGTVALDGDGENSPYANAFLEALTRPNLEVGQFFREIRDSVIAETRGQQEPFLYGSLSAKPVFFQPQAAPTPDPRPAVTPPSDTASQDTLLAIDLAFWESIRDSGTSDDFASYLQRFPEGQFRPLAERRLAALRQSYRPAIAAPDDTQTPDDTPRLERSLALDRSAFR
ncbi:MAG: caspase family protein, partial [Pseudomonadota bacterium]